MHLRRALCHVIFIFLPMAVNAKNLCKQMLVSVTNQTHSTCRLVHVIDARETLVSQGFSRKLLPGETVNFEIWQTYFGGPDITLSYVCDKSFVMFQSKQGMCIFIGTTIKDTIIEQDESIFLQYNDIQESSLLENLPGKVSWIIQEPSKPG